MMVDLPSLITFCAGAVLSMLVSIRLNAQRTAQQQHIVRHGQQGHGRVVHIWRPVLAGSFTRIYFEYQPSGTDEPVRCCHIDRRSQYEMRASLPAIGSTVGIRYLPNDPYRAVITKLVV